MLILIRMGELLDPHQHQHVGFTALFFRDLVGHKVDLAMVKRNPICRIDKVDIVRTNKSLFSTLVNNVFLVASQDGPYNQ
jgi:hypothetical protein